MSLDMGLVWVLISPLPVPYTCFKIGENSNPYPNPIKRGKPVKLSLVRTSTAGMSFVVTPMHKKLIMSLTNKSGN